MIPVIDVFAGPGGLSEGFCAFTAASSHRPFDVRLSIEKDVHAHSTLKLRSFYRAFHPAAVPEAYYEVLRGKLPVSGLYELYPREAEVADRVAWFAELGVNGVAQSEVRARISKALSGSEIWVLIGGPPCQAYSIAGRSRNRGRAGYVFEKDEKTQLYLEYLQILADHRPAVFVMENVKGLLSATLKDQQLFVRMLEDLEHPARALQRERRNVENGESIHDRYKVFSLVKGNLFGATENLNDFVIRAENYGVPQCRHRVILLGIREDLGQIVPGKLVGQNEIAASNVIGDMPALRSGLSGSSDSFDRWAECLRQAMAQRWFKGARKKAGEKVQDRIRQVVESLVCPVRGRGAEFLKCTAKPKYASEWYVDSRLDGLCNFTARTHMPADLHRYLYAACFAKEHVRAPRLADFPPDLLPKHDNVPTALERGGYFSDRFRVQLENAPATTVTSHIAKDGHYYIHPDPRQCRSLTVREAARLQKFADNYFFSGPRTKQYIQVGNAVPPLLAKQIAAIVYGVLYRAGCRG